jgi:naphthalene 1,2-dioxygenase ferredoxin reductase component
MAYIHIEQWPQPIEAGRLRILEAALDAGVPYPHGCGTGECGGCKTQLISGQVQLDACSPEALSEQERIAGVILACRARVQSDVQVRWLSNVAASLPVRKINAQVHERQALAHDVIGLRLALPKDEVMQFHPGQFAKLRVAKHLPARSYSMANQPGEPYLEFHVRVVPDGAVSAYVADELRLGDIVQIRGPFGDAHWQAPTLVQDRPLILIAGGTGMAPMLSVLDAAIAHGVDAQQIHVYHGVRGARDLYAGSYLRNRMDSYLFRFVPVYSHEQVAHAEHGLVHEIFSKDFHDLQHAQIYTAGPPPMVDAVVKAATLRGASADQIRADAFYASEPEKQSLWGRITGWSGLTGWGNV